MPGGEIVEVGVIIERIERMEERSGNSAYERFLTPADLQKFIARVESKLETGSQLCEWRRHRLELSDDTAVELELLKSAYIEWSRPKVMIKAVDVLDLSRYSQRVSGIGIQPRIVSPYIPVQSGDDPWFPESPLSPESNVPVSVPIGDDRTLELLVDSKVYETLKQATEQAETSGGTTISMPGHPDTVPVAAARAIIDELDDHFGNISSPLEPVHPAPRKESPGLGKEKSCCYAPTLHSLNSRKNERRNCNLLLTRSLGFRRA